MQHKDVWFTVVLLGILSCLLQTTRADTCKACLNFDEYSFNKIVPRFKYALVKYDIAYPYGPKHETFVQFAEELAGVKDIIVAEVGIKDYGQKENKDFALAQNVDVAKLPAIKLYMGLNKVATLDLVDDLSVESLREFIVVNSDVHITLAGCIQELDALAAAFMKATSTDVKQKVLQQAEEYKTDVEGEQKMAKAYVAYMKKLVDDGNFIEKENKRLKKILAEGKLAEGKKIDLQQKLNVLHSFESKASDKNEKKQEL